MKTVKEVSKLTGVSVRTLHYYDAIGLLKPAKVTDAGYRLYDDAALARLQTILLYRELQFPLKTIREILSSGQFDAAEALSQQIRLLELQYNHLGNLITYAREIQKRGVKEMSFTVFDNKEVEKYKSEIKERWGNTAAYQESETRKAADDAPRQMMEIFKRFAALRHLPPESEKVQALVHELQQHITDNYYTCTKDILCSLGELYVNDERFHHNIDLAAGVGTAAFASQAIAIFCQE